MAHVMSMTERDCFMGKKYHLEVKSIVGAGTTIMIKFPIRLME